MPTQLTVVAGATLLIGVLVIVALLIGSRRSPGPSTELTAPPAAALDAEAHGVAEPTLRLVWWLTTAVVLVGVGISGSFDDAHPAIFGLGAVGVLAALLFHELVPLPRRTVLHLVELLVATALVSGLLVFTGSAASPFAILFALVAVAAALAHGPRAGLAAAAMATVAFALVLLGDPARGSYTADDALRLSTGLGTTWLLAFLAIAYAIRDRRRMDRERARARTDPLTGLLNRAHLFSTLDLEVSRTRRSDRGFCLLMIDLDGLKQVNDSAGHLAGDAAIRTLAATILASIRTVDSAYRYGGDEFVVLLPETDIVGAFVVAEKIRVGVEETEAGGAGVSVSIGLVSHPEDGMNGEELIAAADRAMYQAKSLGKNQISGNPRPRPALIARRSTLAAQQVAVPVAPAQPEPRPEVTPEPAAAPVPEPAVAPEPVAPVATASGSAPAALEPEPRGELPTSGDATAATAATPEPAAAETTSPTSGPILLGTAAPAREAEEDEQPDAQEVRRQIAAARRSFDPDDQIRRAMDAFLSPTIDRERRTPDA